MALREFVDSNGVYWKVWDVSADQVHQRLKDEKVYLGYDLGWLAFESADGALRRRLCPCPPKWDQSSDEELEALCAEAEAVAPRSRPVDLPGAEPGRATAQDEDVARVSVEVRERQDEPPEAARRSLRTFQYPGGRIWTVGIMRLGGGVGGREILRFASGAHRVDLEHWPDDWATYSDAQLAELLREGAPPRQAMPNPTAHRRRHDDMRP